MSVTFTPKEIVETALKRIGRLSTYDTGADPVDLDTGLVFLDQLIAEHAASANFPWLNPDVVEVPLNVAAQKSYSLAALAAGSKVQFVTAAVLRPLTGDEVPLTIITKRSYDEIGNKAAAGAPERVCITRGPSPKLFVWPVPAITTLKLVLSIQTYAANFSQDKGKVAHGWPEAFQRWMGLELACDLADGPILQADAGKLDRLEKKSAKAWARLVPYATRQNSRGRRSRGVAYRDF